MSVPFTTNAEIFRVNGAGAVADADPLAVEEPLELRLDYGEGPERQVVPVAVTMRTPGHDLDLALGFLVTEGLLTSAAQVDTYRHSGPDGGLPHNRNILTLRLKPGITVDADRLQRHFYMTSSCGVCGKSSLDAVRVACPPLPLDDFGLEATSVHAMIAKLVGAQGVFATTGGVHAAALFDADGHLLAVREDVGRHNAVDKLIGDAVFKEQVPLSNRVLVVSGRAGFELVQKAAVARIPVFVAVGAPTSLAVDLAQAQGMTLIGFARDGRFNVYAGTARLAPHALRSSD